MPSVPFDPFSQNFTLTDNNGENFIASMATINDLNLDNIKQSLNYGAQIGLSVLMFVTLLLLTQPGKRQSPIFFLNVAALTLNTVKSALIAVYMTGNWSNTYAIVSGDYSRVTDGDIAVSIADTVIKAIELVVIEVSLILQVNVVLITAQRVQRFWLTVLTITVAMIAIGFQTALTVINSIAIKNGIYAAAPPDLARIASAANITLTISVCFFMTIFVWKLGYALKQRRSLGLRKFGPMQVIFIMGLQTMIVPTIFCGLMYTSPIDMSSLVMTLLAISLPLSSLWATVSIESAAPSNRPHVKKPKPISVGASGAYDSTAGKSGKSKGTSPATSHDGLISPYSPESEKDVEKGVRL